MAGTIWNFLNSVAESPRFQAECVSDGERESSTRFHLHFRSHKLRWKVEQVCTRRKRARKGLPHSHASLAGNKG